MSRKRDTFGVWGDRVRGSIRDQSGRCGEGAERAPGSDREAIRALAGRKTKIECDKDHGVLVDCANDLRFNEADSRH
jgi:hypothetical protein